ncbi:MAG TPA: hypothetical protein VLJ37_10890 [bacterium]|nr:hypothetical protein [bacterium]
MSGLHIAPLTTIPAALIQALADSPAYRSAGSLLLGDVCAFDAHLGHAGIARPAEGRTDYFLDCRQMDLPAVREIFLAIRARKDEIEAGSPLLAPVASLVDYFCHMTANVLPLTDREPRLFASVAEGDAEITFPWESNETRAFEWSVAVYLGLSPLPVFGYGLQYSDPRVIRSLSTFGLGVFSYLHYAIVPALAAHQGMIPHDIAVTVANRPIAPALIQRQGDGSYVLTPP